MSGPVVQSAADLPFRDLADIAAIEAVPIEDRLPFDNIYDLFRTAAAARGEADALVWLPNGRAADVPVVFSHADLLAEITRAANFLRSLGLVPGRAATLLLPNLPETVFFIWGAAVAGIANPVNPMLAASHIAAIMTAAESDVLVTAGPDVDPALWAKAVEVAQLHKIGAIVIVAGGIPADAPSGTMDYRQHAHRHAADHLLCEVPTADRVSCYFHTGGTTGVPKLAQHTHANQLATAWAINCLLKIRPDDRFLVGLPLFHVNAAVGTGLSVYFPGATVLLCGQQGYRNAAMLDEFWRIAASHRATYFSGVPTIFARLLDLLPEDLDVSTVRMAFCGAAPMPVPLFREFEQRTGIAVLEGWGMTEGCFGSSANPRDGVRKIGSVGLRLPYQEVRVAKLDDDGVLLGDCAVGEIGTLLIKGPNVFPGYKQAQHNTMAWPAPGFFNTGDLGRFDEDGYLWLAGRSKDLIIRGGHNIDPGSVEEVLHRHPAVELAAVVGRPHPDVGEVPVAFVVLKTGATVTGEELRVFARANVAERPAAPVDVMVVPTLPMTAVGKLYKPPLREDAARQAIEQALVEVVGVAASLFEVVARTDDAGAMRVEVGFRSAAAPDAELVAEVERLVGKFPGNFSVSQGGAFDPNLRGIHGEHEAGLE